MKGNYNSVKNEKMKKNIFIPIISSVLILLWAYAALSKLIDYQTFGLQLKLQPLPSWSIPVLKIGLPVMELIIAVLLFTQKTQLFGLKVSMVLLVAFTLYVAIALSGTFGNIPCSCAGIISALKWKGHLIFNLCFTIINGYGLYLHSHSHDIRINEFTQKV